MRAPARPPPPLRLRLAGDPLAKQLGWALPWGGTAPVGAGRGPLPVPAPHAGPDAAGRHLHIGGHARELPARAGQSLSSRLEQLDRSMPFSSTSMLVTTPSSRMAA